MSDKKEGGDKPPNYDYTSTKRGRDYTARANEVAQKFGFGTWRKFTTFVLNNEDLQAAIVAAVVEYQKGNS